MGFRTIIKSASIKEKLQRTIVAITKVEQRIDEVSRIAFQLNGANKIILEYFPAYEQTDKTK